MGYFRMQEKVLFFYTVRLVRFIGALVGDEKRSYKVDNLTPEVTPSINNRIVITTCHMFSTSVNLY